MIEKSAKRKLDALLALENDEDPFRSKKISTADDNLTIEEDLELKKVDHKQKSKPKSKYQKWVEWNT